MSNPKGNKEPGNSIGFTTVFCVGFFLALGGMLGLHTGRNVISIFDSLTVLLPTWF